jgi:metal-dependent amidase/aminoacylase/carboxypeptidase family protein
VSNGTECDAGAADTLDTGSILYRRIRETWHARHPHADAPGIRLPAINAPSAVERARKTARTTDVGACATRIDPVGVSDDFGWYAATRPGTLIFIGCDRGGQSADLHGPRFDFDEQALRPRSQ